MVHGSFPVGEIDHEDQNGLNNRASNLRDVVHVKNQQNRVMNPLNTSGQMGVGYCKRERLWRARIKVKGIEIGLGYFKDKDEAIAVRKAAESQYGFHKNHGRKRA